MTHLPRAPRARSVLGIAAVLLVAGCGLGPASPSAAPSVGPPSTTTPSPGQSGAASSPPIASPSPTSSPAPSFAACELPAWHGPAPSGRLVGLEVRTAGSIDTVTFRFEPGGDNPGTPVGDIKPVKPPFTEGASGQPISVEGDRFLQVRFDKMTIEDASGVVFKGEHNVKPRLPAVRQVVNYDEFEGVVGWIVGLADPSCVTVARDPTTITLRAAHP